MIRIRTLVKDVMTKTPKTCTRDSKLEDVSQTMLDEDCGSIPVVVSKDELKPIGIITDRDIVCRVVAKKTNPIGQKVGDFYSEGCFTIRKDAKLSECCHLMEEKQVRRIVVVDNAGRCCGIVSQADLAECGSGRQIINFLKKVSRPLRIRRKAAA